MLKRSAISLGLVGSALYHPSCESFSKVIFTADQEHFGRVLQGSQEMIACAVSLLQVFQRINGWVHGAPQLFFKGTDRVEDVVEGNAPDDHQVDVAGGIVVAAGYGAIDEGEVDAGSEGRQSFLQQLENTHRLREEGAEFRKDGVVAIGSVKDLATEDGTQDEAGFGEKIQLAAGGACACANVAGDLAKEERLVGSSEEEGQDLASGLAEKQVSDGWGVCTHFEYNCTQNEYGRANQSGEYGRTVRERVRCASFRAPRTACGSKEGAFGAIICCPNG
jgi:hypothetical protein